jgi:hypothetical protein
MMRGQRFADETNRRTAGMAADLARTANQIEARILDGRLGQKVNSRELMPAQISLANVVVTQ